MESKDVSAEKYIDENGKIWERPTAREFAEVSTNLANAIKARSKEETNSAELRGMKAAMDFAQTMLDAAKVCKRCDY